MAKKKSLISKIPAKAPKPPKKDNRPPGLMTLANGDVVEERYRNDYGARRIYKKKRKDPEAAPAPKDAASKMKYPPPKNNPVFRETWVKFISSVTGREGFKEAHLVVLEVLCDLYTEYADLTAIIRKEGMTYELVSRFGSSRKMHPAALQIDKVRGNIRTYTQQLNLFPKKDHSTEADGEEEEWG